MSTATLPKALRKRIASVGQKLHRRKVVRGISRIALLLVGVAAAIIAIDILVGLPMLMRCAALLGWGVLAFLEIRRFYREVWVAPIDAEGVASVIEEEYPRLSERLTTAVELVGTDDPANGSPELIADVVSDVDVRTRKLDFDKAASERWTIFLGALAVGVLLGVFALLAFGGGSGEYLRRFFLPFYSPTPAVVEAGYRVVVTSGHPTLKRGETVALTAHVELVRAGATLPSTATLLVKAESGSLQRLPMEFDAEKSVAHLKHGPVDAGFEYAIEAGQVTSDWHRVTVIEPIRLESITATITPPDYAKREGEPLDKVQGLSEIKALQYSQIQWEMRFNRLPSTARVEWRPTVDPDRPPINEITNLTIDAAGRTTYQLKAIATGELRLIVDSGKAGTTFPAQVIQITTDTPPKFEKVEGVAHQPRFLRPGEKPPLDVVVSDDVAITLVEVEYRINQGPIQKLPPLPLRGIGTSRAGGSHDLDLADKIKEGDTFEYRLVATDNRSIPEVKLTPQQSYYPGETKWSEFRISKNAAPLKEQDILAKKKDVDERLKKILRELEQEQRVTYRMKSDTAKKPKLDANEAAKLDDVNKQVRETAESLDELARDLGLSADTEDLARAARDVGEREVRDADGAINQARKDEKAEPRTKNLEKADTNLTEAIKRLEKLRQENERLAQSRLDKERLERLMREQRDLADQLQKAKDDPEEIARIKEQQKKLEEQLKQLAAESELVREAIRDANHEKTDELAKKVRDLEQQQRDLNQAIKNAEQEGRQGEIGELQKKQEELAKKAKELAKRTDAASRLGQLDPLNPTSADKAADALRRGDLKSAIEAQEKAAYELSRMSRDLEKAVQQTRDPRKAAEMLQRLQRDLKNRFEESTKDNRPLTEAEKKALSEEQEAIRKAAEKLSVPQDAARTKQQATDEAAKAAEAIRSNENPMAQAKMDATAKALEKLAEQLPSQEKRLATARGEVAKLKQEQDDLARQAEAVANSIGKQDPADPATQRDVARKAADLTKKQAQIAEKLSKLDTPGHDDRRDRTQDAMRKAMNDLSDGNARDIPASQQSAKRELDRLEQALGGQKPADEQADILAKKQRQLADELTKNAEKPMPGKAEELQKQQAELNRDLEKLQAQEAPASRDDAMKLTRKTEQSLKEGKSAEAADQANEAAQALQRLADQMNGRRSEQEQIDQLAKKQRENADEADQLAKKNPAEARKKAQQMQDELKSLRSGNEGAKDKQRAMDALKEAQQAGTPEQIAKAQQQAAEALEDLAEKLTREKPSQPKTEDAEKLTKELAEKQRQLQKQTEQALQKAHQQPGEEGKRATEEALQRAEKQQRELNQQASRIPANDTPQELEQAKNAMNQAEQAAAKKDGGDTVKKQGEAAQALEKLAKQAAEQAAKKPTGDDQASDRLPNRGQSDEARQLAQEQRQLRDQLARNMEQQNGKQPRDKENPVAPLAKEQGDIAEDTEKLTRELAQQQGEKSEEAKQAQQAADAAKQATQQLKNGELNPAKDSGRQTSQKLEQLAQGSGDPKMAQRAKDLAQRQEELNKKMESLGNNNRAARAQQGERQGELQQDLDQLQKQLEQLSKQLKQQDGGGTPADKMESAAAHLRQAQEAMKEARKQERGNNPDQARQSREDASRAMELARQQANEAMKQLQNQQPENREPGNPQAGESLQRAREQMQRSQQQLGQGQPGEASKAMQDAAQSLQRAANQMNRPQQGQPNGQNGQPNPNGQNQGNPMQGTSNGQNTGKGQGTPDLTPFAKILEKYPGKSWGELPGKVQTEVIQEMSARYGEEYARSIKLYFEQLAERK